MFLGINLIDILAVLDLIYHTLFKLGTVSFQDLINEDTNPLKFKYGWIIVRPHYYWLMSNPILIVK